MFCFISIYNLCIIIQQQKAKNSENIFFKFNEGKTMTKNFQSSYSLIKSNLNQHNRFDIK